LQESITKLLEEVSGVAEGDLTREAEVTADVTGAIADSFNYMIEQLREIISTVQGATLQVTSSANQIQETATNLVEGSDAQAQQIVQTTAALDQMAARIQQVSHNAGSSSEVARQALANARHGTEAVHNTIQGMNRIRDQVQETAKRIKRLGESSQEIGQIIQLIDDIADRTSILALNASIQAAMAGESGRGFAVVAEEVERLAVRSTEATKKIATLVKTIQGETNEAVAAMEKGIHEVVEGSKLANQAGQALGEIEGVSNKLAELIESITQTAKEQARSSEELVKAMGEISQITQETATGTRQTAESVTGLAALADDLRSSLSTFRLPNTRESRWEYETGHKNGKGNGEGANKNILRPQSAPVVFVDN
jgi:twitching motility protein PilJ